MESSQTESTLFPVEKMRPNIDMFPTKGESLREYVPGPGIGDPAKWYGLCICIEFIIERKIFKNNAQLKLTESAITIINVFINTTTN